jgi:hypothetical protein
MNDFNDRRDRELVERARQLFRDGADNLDGATRSRLRQARARAVEAAARRSGSTWLAPRRLAPVGGVIAAALALAVFWSAPEPAMAPVESAVLDDLDLLLEGEELELFEELEFYAWLLEQPEMLEPAAADDGSG